MDISGIVKGDPEGMFRIGYPGPKHQKIKKIDDWVIEEFKKVGLDTAKSILELDQSELIKRTDLEEETIKEVIRILKEEFEE